MIDEAERLTDEALAALEKRIARIYREARDALEAQAQEYFRKFIKRDEEMREMLDAGDIAEADYRDWRLTQIARGQRFTALRDQCADRLVHVNETAAAYVNDTTPTLMSLGHNYAAYELENLGHGLNIGIDFILWNEQTVRRLITEVPDLLPPAKIDIFKDQLWNRNKITNEITAAIIRGERVSKIAARMRDVTGANEAAARRTARTAITNAQNAGRQDTYTAAAKMGIKSRKRWVSAHDARVRHSHAMLDGQTVAIDAPFVSTLGSRMMHPGDWSLGAVGADIYNCRCAMRTVEKDGIEAEPRMMRVRDPETGRNVIVNAATYSDWMRAQGRDAFGNQR